METAKRLGRIVGVLLLLHMACGYVVNFVLLAPLFAAPGFLVTAAPHSSQVGLAVLTGLATGALSLAIAITAYPVFRQYSQAMALWFFALAVVNCALIAVEHVGLMSSLSLSQAYVKAGSAQDDLFQALRIVVASARNWAHYIGLIFAGGMFLTMYGTLYRFALIPRPLAAFGLAAVLLQITAVAMPIFGRDIVFLMLMPLGLSQLALALWLIVRSFASATSSEQR